MQMLHKEVGSCAHKGLVGMQEAQGHQDKMATCGKTVTKGEIENLEYKNRAIVHF